MPRTDRQPIVELWIGGIEFKAQSYLKELSVTKTLGILSGTLQLYDPDWTILESYILPLGYMTPITFNYGWQLEPLKEVTGRLKTYKSTLDGSGVTIDIEFTLGVMAKGRVKRHLNYEEGQVISDIVSQIAQRNNWDRDIEPTQGVFDVPMIQRGVSDIHFISRVLAPRAVNVNGIGGYYTHFENNKIVFRTQHSKTKQALYKSYMVYRDAQGEVISFSPSDRSTDIALVGGRNLRVRSFDTRDKQVIESDITPSSGVPQLKRLGSKISKITEEADKNEPNRIIHKGYANTSEVNNYAKSRWVEMSSMMYDADAEILGDPNIKPGDLVAFKIVTPNGVTHHTSGVYWIKEVTDNLSGDSFTTTLFMKRHGDSEGGDSLQGDQQDIVRIIEPRVGLSQLPVEE